MKLLLSALLVAGLLPVLHAQAPPPPTDVGPTMEQTRTWLETDGRDLMRANRLQGDRLHRTITASEEHVETITLAECTLFWRTVRTGHITIVTAAGSQVGPATTRTTDVKLVLADLSVGSISVEPDTLLTDAPVYAVRLVLRGQQVGASSTSSTDAGNPKGIRAASVPVQTAEDGQRIANALKRATVLCGVTKVGVF